MDLHRKKAFDRHKGTVVGTVFALFGFWFSIFLSVIGGRDSIETAIYVALVCTLLNWLVGSMLGGYTTLYDKGVKKDGGKPGAAPLDIGNCHQNDGRQCT